MGPCCCVAGSRAFSRSKSLGASIAQAMSCGFTVKGFGFDAATWLTHETAKSPVRSSNLDVESIIPREDTDVSGAVAPCVYLNTDIESTHVSRSS